MKHPTIELHPEFIHFRMSDRTVYKNEIDNFHFVREINPALCVVLGVLIVVSFLMMFSMSFVTVLGGLIFLCATMILLYTHINLWSKMKTLYINNECCACGLSPEYANTIRKHLVELQYG